MRSFHQRGQKERLAYPAQNSCSIVYIAILVIRWIVERQQSPNQDFHTIFSKPIMSMKAVVFRGPFDVGVETRPKPAIRDSTDAIIRVKLAGICGR